MPPATPARRLVIITGPSGAGLSTAGAALEDAGYEAIDNLPLRLVKPLLAQPENDFSMALSLDTRNRDFSTEALLELIGDLSGDSTLDVQHVYLDCQTDTLLRRYSVTKRRHPFAQAANLSEAIAREQDLLRPIRARADILIDTTDLNPHELRAEIGTWLVPDGHQSSAVQVQSFSYKRGLPRSADLVFDCRFLRNPYWQVALREQDGRDPDVADYVAGDPRYQAFFEKVRDLALFLLPAAQEEGKSYLSIAFGCTGGRHRSVAVTEHLAHALAEAGWQVSVRHREIGRQMTGKEARL